MRKSIFIFLISVSLITSCNSYKKENTQKRLFKLIPVSHSSVKFNNHLSFNRKFNIYTYRNFYDGGGVAIGDVNNDGLPDIYFVSNQDSNRLYLNEGDFHFKDITKESGVAGVHSWSTGATMADVNGDGLLDIYVCNSGITKGDNRKNELFINKGTGKDGIPHFKEEAEKFGIADSGYSIQAAFFDYDGDGDLDLYVLNNSYKAIGGFNLRLNERNKRNYDGGDRLYRNDNGHFVDVSKKAGIYGSEIGFGLGVTINDYNRDGWPDMYISNDFFERDYLYLNNHDGTFKEVLTHQITSTSAASMGADAADINNDGYPDIFVTDMLPKDQGRLIVNTTFDSWKHYQFLANNGYYHQFTRNTLQLNNGDGTFSEIGRMAGVDATDWSWGSLIMDLDNDGNNDIFVANGIYRDLTDQDYINTMSNPHTVRTILSNKKTGILKMIDMIPSHPLANAVFANRGGLQFGDSTRAWGLARPGFANGSAYGDLNNDGALDLVINNVNGPASIYENRSDSLRPGHHWLMLRLKGRRPNTGAIGAEVTLWCGGEQFYREEMPTRGFESSVDPRLHFGLGAYRQVDSLRVRWPDGQVSVRRRVSADQLLTLGQPRATRPGHSTRRVSPKASIPLLTNVTGPSGIRWSHREDKFNDFTRNPLLFQMRSNEGPKICTGDVNGDGRTDFYVGGAKGQPGALFVRQADGSFRRMSEPAIAADKLSEDIGCTFFDADGDGDQDLYVASGSDEFPASSSALGDRLYLNDGHGHFTRSPQNLPTGRYVSSSVVRAGDFNGDGKPDLFVGERMKPFDYGVPTGGYLLENEGNAEFKDVTAQVAPGLRRAGMITDALWSDYDGDGDPDLIVVGEWMGIQIWRNDHGRFTNVSARLGLAHTKGWWDAIAAGDLNGDGRPDYVVGNLGLNSQLKASRSKPVRMYVGDFNGNGLVEHILTAYQGDKAYPLALRQDLLAQFPDLKNKYPTYKSYRRQTIGDIFTAAQLSQARVDTAEELRSVELLSQTDGTYKVIPLPLRAQISPVYGIAITDVNGDGHADVVLGGNQYAVKPQLGRYDASWGAVLLADGHGHLRYIGSKQSGLRVRGQIRSIARLKGDKQEAPLLIIARNNKALNVYKINKHNEMHTSSAKK
ncbi:MAG TPA: VCBS repeat-containing protein [Balneolales bacterium]|nr:VCBS repeat-containing protein [Balneolales bacterium]